MAILNSGTRESLTHVYDFLHPSICSRVAYVTMWTHDAQLSRDEDRRLVPGTWDMEHGTVRHPI